MRVKGCVAPHLLFRYSFLMSLQQLKSEAAALSDAERRELIGYLIARGRERSESYWDALAAKIDDQDPAHWVREEELDRALGLDRPGV